MIPVRGGELEHSACFLVRAQEDVVVPVENISMLYEANVMAGDKVKMHLNQAGAVLAFRTKLHRTNGPTTALTS